MPIARLADSSLHYVDRGNGPIVVLLLHAFPMHAGMWRAQLDALSSHARVIAPDVRGFGDSGAAPSVLTMSAIADDVHKLLDALAVDQALVCGLSMGGYVAFELWRSAPEIFAGLVLADTRAGADTPAARAGRETFADDALQKGLTWVADTMIPKLLRPGHDPMVAASVRAIIQESSAGGVAAAQRGMARRRDSTDLLAGIDVPTLVLVGKDDGLTAPAVAAEMAAAIPGARCQVLEGAGHLSNLEAPGAFTTALVQFVADHGG